MLIARIAVGLSLAAAGLLKVWPLLTDSRVASDEPLVAAATVLELLLAVAVLVWRSSALPMWAVAWTLIAFTLTLLVREIAEPGWARTCGCFGDDIHLTFWQHLTINAALLLLAHVSISGAALWRRPQKPRCASPDSTDPGGR